MPIGNDMPPIIKTHLSLRDIKMWKRYILELIKYIILYYNTFSSF